MPEKRIKIETYEVVYACDDCFTPVDFIRSVDSTGVPGLLEHLHKCPNCSREIRFLGGEPYPRKEENETSIGYLHCGY